ncbi:heme binding [Tulasnella sp. 408]|nr:heme binding [Tulasnella sp. 408]
MATPNVTLETNMGEITFELYWDHAPQVRCYGKFVQGGDPTGTGRGGTSIYGNKFEDELNQELRFVGAGILAMANSGPNTNGPSRVEDPKARDWEADFVAKGSQFFITLAPTPFLDGKHTIFGRVKTGMAVVRRLGSVATDAQDRPKEEVKIFKARIATEETE